MVAPRATLEVDGREISFSNPDKVFFPVLGLTKKDLIEYYVSVGAGALVGCRDRPSLMKRYPNGADGEHFFQKRVPSWKPEWLQTAHVAFPSGRTAEFVAPADVAHIVWMVSLGCIDLNPWNVRRADVDHPDELRIDLDPTPGIPFSDVRDVAMIINDILTGHGLVGWPATSGSRGMHIAVRIHPRWTFTDVRRAALAVGRECERQTAVATTAWWKEERVGVFIDYNMNARDRTLASVYSPRPVPDARVACPLRWDEVPDVEPADLTVLTVPGRYASIGDPGAAIDEHPGSLDELLELAERQEGEGATDAPWPPQFPKQPGEPPRVMPSRARKEPKKPAGGRRNPGPSRRGGTRDRGSE